MPLTKNELKELIVAYRRLRHFKENGALWAQTKLFDNMMQNIFPGLDGALEKVRNKNRRS